jgi:hypothetical protein
LIWIKQAAGPRGIMSPETTRRERAPFMKIAFVVHNEGMGKEILLMLRVWKADSRSESRAGSEVVRVHELQAREIRQFCGQQLKFACRQSDLHCHSFNRKTLPIPKL